MEDYEMSLLPRVARDPLDHIADDWPKVASDGEQDLRPRSTETFADEATAEKVLRHGERLANKQLRGKEREEKPHDHSAFADEILARP